MELYLRWLEKYEQQRGEDSPIGLILCADKSEEQIKLLQLDKGGIRVAAYLTELPPRRLRRRSSMRRYFWRELLWKKKAENQEMPNPSRLAFQFLMTQ
jgi:hypothetical protein